MKNLVAVCHRWLM